MARKRFSFKRKAKSYVGKIARFTRRKSSSKGTAVFQLDAMVYGGLRNNVASMVVPSVERFLPFGNMNDEATMGVISWAMAKYGSGMIRDIGNKGLTVENARVGESLIGGGLSSLTTGKTTTNEYAYG